MSAYIKNEIQALFSKNSDKNNNILQASWIDTPLGPMLAISDEKDLYLLEFLERRSLKREIERLKVKTKSDIILGTTSPTTSIEAELKSYFSGDLTEFKTPLHIIGTPFQKLAWDSLTHIPHGKTISYAEQAIAVNRPTAHRAIANANGCNHFAIVIPCHRVISSSGDIGGYAGGIQRKKWLIDHESSILT